MNACKHPGIYTPLQTSATKMEWRRPRKLTADEILKIVSIESDIPIPMLKAKGRQRHLADARFLAMYFINEIVGLSSIRIGRFFNRDHTTVLHALRMVKDLYKTDKQYRRRFEEIRWLIDKAGRGH